MSNRTRAKMSAAKKGRPHPISDLSADQKKLYLKLRPIVGRVAALTEVLRGEGAP
jgi:hypothetical protein